uniref:Uncharacterized protein n=1 Tax=Anguilla anguilla TaxID=7936 RepID=A0A0E9RPF0_ANGAN
MSLNIFYLKKTHLPTFINAFYKCIYKCLFS